MRRHALAMCSGLFVLLAARTVFAIPVARFQAVSDPGDWVGQGQSYDVTYDDVLDRPRTEISSRQADGSPATVAFTSRDARPGLPELRVQFSTHYLGVPIVPGFYPNANGHLGWPGPPRQPGIYISIDGRGGSNPGGSFTLHELIFNVDRTVILRLIADFEQYGQFDAPTTAIRGRIEYNADGLAAIPEPSTALLMLLGLAGLSVRRRLV